MNHNGNTNKMVDTPMTTDRVVFIDGNPWVNAPFARSLERELNAANARIKRLEEAGDFMAYNDQLDFEELVERWRKAKEAKP